MFAIIWKREAVDEFETLAEAKAMLAEYNLAFSGGCTLRPLGLAAHAQHQADLHGPTLSAALGEIAEADENGTLPPCA
jgi:hypothetical protein